MRLCILRWFLATPNGLLSVDRCWCWEETMPVSHLGMLSTERGIGLLCRCSTIMTVVPDHGYAPVPVFQVPGCARCCNTSHGMLCQNPRLAVTPCSSRLCQHSQLAVTPCSSTLIRSNVIHAYQLCDTVMHGIACAGL